MKKQEFIDIALKYVNEYHYSIIPVGLDKKPLIEWREFQNRLPGYEEIRKWSDFPNVQIGIVTGEISNLTVVDIELGGDSSYLPQNTTIVETGGGGAHFYYRFYPNIKNKARVKELTDIRSTGGYVVAAGSESTKGKYKFSQELPILDFPAELFSDSKSSVDIFSATSRNIDIDYPGYPSGSRNQEMTRYIGKILTKIHPSLWDREAWKIIVDANQKNTPPLSPNELRTCYESIKRTEVTRNSDRWNKKENYSNTTPVKKEWETEEEKEDGKIMLMSEAAKLQHIDISKFYPLGFPVFDSEIRGGAIPGDLIVVAGQTGHGKTTFAMNLAKNFISGGEKVLFFSYEVLVQFVWENFKLMGMKDEDFVFCPFKNVTGNVEWIEKKIKEAKEKYDIKFVVIDHLGFLAPKMKGISSRTSENYSLYLTSIVRDLKTIAKSEGIVIILPVHMRKRESFYKRNTELDINDIAHSAGVAQESDLVFLINREQDIRPGAADVFSGFSLISLAKNRRGSKCPKGYFSLINGCFAHDAMYGGVDTQGSTAKSASGMTASKIASETKIANKVDKEAGILDEDGQEFFPW